MRRTRAAVLLLAILAGAAGLLSISQEAFPTDDWYRESVARIWTTTELDALVTRLNSDDALVRFRALQELTSINKRDHPGLQDLVLDNFMSELQSGLRAESRWLAPVVWYCGADSYPQYRTIMDRALEEAWPGTVFSLRLLHRFAELEDYQLFYRAAAFRHDRVVALEALAAIEDTYGIDLRGLDGQGSKWPIPVRVETGSLSWIHRKLAWCRTWLTSVEEAHERWVSVNNTSLQECPLPKLPQLCSSLMESIALPVEEFPGRQDLELNNGRIREDYDLRASPGLFLMEQMLTHHPDVVASVVTGVDLSDAVAVEVQWTALQQHASHTALYDESKPGFYMRSKPEVIYKAALVTLATTDPVLRRSRFLACQWLTDPGVMLTKRTPEELRLLLRLELPEYVSTERAACHWICVYLSRVVPVEAMPTRHMDNYRTCSLTACSMADMLAQLQQSVDGFIWSEDSRRFVLVD